MATARRTLEQVNATVPDVDFAMMDATKDADIRRHRIEDGEDPDAPAGQGQLVVPPALVRDGLGLTQQAFANLIGVPVGTVRNWEQGRTRPEPAARTLLAMLGKDPQATVQILKTLRAA